jgi:ADP-ribose pyrophosphatase YjhB (NUDIX family)
VSGSSQAEPRAVAAVGAVVVDRTGRVLLIRRGRPPSAGAWTLPGGRVEPGESTEHAVVREVREETALQAHVVCGLGVVNVAREGFVYEIHEHLLAPVSVGDAPPRAGDDAADVRWVDPRELSGLAVALDAITVIDRGLEEARARGLTPDRD